MRCEEIRDLTAELALGIADGEERAEALRHLSTCAECRREVEQLSQVADELLLLAPVQEPPAGFESRVVDAMGLERRPRRRLARWLTPRWLAPRLGPALAAAAVTAAVLIGVYQDDRQTADRYRAVLDQANGQYFLAERLADGTGAQGGVAVRGGRHARPRRPGRPGRRARPAAAQAARGSGDQGVARGPRRRHPGRAPDDGRPDDPTALVRAR